jgi:hypothetical protein
MCLALLAGPASAVSPRGNQEPLASKLDPKSRLGCGDSIALPVL